MPNQNVTEAEFIRMLVVGITGKDLQENYLTELWSDKYYHFLHFKNYPVHGFADKTKRPIHNAGPCGRADIQRRWREL